MRLEAQSNELILEVIEGLGLLGTVGDPIVHGYGVIEFVVYARARVIKRKKVEPKGTRVVHLVLRIVSFDAQRTGPLAEIDGQSTSHGSHVCPIGLEDVAPDVRPQFISGIALQCFGCLPKLQVEAETETLTVRRIGSILKHNVRLIQAERITAHIIGTKKVYASDRIVKVVAVVTIQHKIDGRTAE